MSSTGSIIAVWGDSARLGLARSLAATGARVVLLLPPGSAREGGARTECFIARSRQPEALEALAASVWEATGGISGLVVRPSFAIAPLESAAASLPAALEVDEAAWHAALSAALEVPFFLSRAFAERMRETGGRIVLVVSAASPPGAELLGSVVREGAITMGLGLAKALPSAVRAHVVVAAADRKARRGAAGVVDSVRFLLTEPALPSGTVIRLDRERGD